VVRRLLIAFLDLHIPGIILNLGLGAVDLLKGNLIFTLHVRKNYIVWGFVIIIKIKLKGFAI